MIYRDVNCLSGFLLSVCPSVMEGRQRSLDLAPKATAARDTSGWRLRERCHCGCQAEHWRQVKAQVYLVCWTRTRYKCTLTCHSMQTVRQPDSGVAISWGSFTGAEGCVPTWRSGVESIWNKLQKS